MLSFLIKNGFFEAVASIVAHGSGFCDGDHILLQLGGAVGKMRQWGGIIASGSAAWACSP